MLPESIDGFLYNLDSLSTPTPNLSSCRPSEFFSVLRASTMVCFCMRLSVNSRTRDSNSYSVVELIDFVANCKRQCVWFIHPCNIISCYLNLLKSSIKMLNQRTNGPVNAHLIFWPSKAQNIENLEIIP